MPIPGELIKPFIARTIVIGVLSYFLLEGRMGRVTPNSMMEHAMVGAVGAGGSLISQGYLENPGMMFGTLA
jgi:hypothetical protein